MHRLPINQAQIGFVYERCRLKAVIRTFARHVVPGEAVEFTVDEWSELRQRLLISITPGKKQLG